jgi:hypothetical protein
MPMARRVTLLLLLSCLGISVWWGSSIARNVPGGPLDFQAVYYGARCLLQHHNPYRVAEVEALYRSEGGEHQSDSIQRRQTVTLHVNLPATFLFIAPFTMLPLGAAQVLWSILIAASLLLAAFLIWKVASEDAPILSACLIGLLLANSELVFLTGNTVGIVVSLCVVAVWCFIEDRLVPAGILCMAVSLVIKPHDAGLVWLYFLLVGGVYRKRALQSLAVTAALALPAFLWVSLAVPHWIGDWRTNMAAISAPGGLNSPGPASMTINILGSVVSLQTVFAAFRDDPRFYNPLTYLVCGALLAAWSVRTLRSGFSRAGAWLALAAIAPITTIITYHRSYDAKLLLLTVPACALLWSRGGAIRWVALVINTAAFVLTADFPLTILMIWARDLHVPAAGILAQIVTVVRMRPAPLILLVMGIFYLWVYIWRTDSDELKESKKAEGLVLPIGEASGEPVPFHVARADVHHPAFSQSIAQP